MIRKYVSLEKIGYIGIALLVTLYFFIDSYILHTAGYF